MSGSFNVGAKVSFVRLLSSILVIWFTTLSVAQAHEVLPSIADMTESDGTLTFDVRLNLESFVAGIDQSQTSDTNESANAATYDDLRALSPAALEDRFRTFWPQMAEGIKIRAGTTEVTPELLDVSVGPVGDIDVVRPSTLQFTATLPEGAQNVQVGWTREFGTLVLRQQGVAEPATPYLEAGAISEPINLQGGGQASGWQVFVDYIPVGFDHIVPKGLDHILFVLGLFFLSTHLRPLLWQVSLFTVAHTITLALAALGHTQFLDDFFVQTFNIPFIAVVEPLIAASIVYVAVENIFMKNLSPWRPVVVFLFGLLHGLGFASVLGEFGLPDHAFVPALIGFNIGVEFGQLAVIAVMFLCVWQAIRIDRGANEVFQAKALYAVLALAAIAVIALDPPALEAALEASILLFLVPLLVIFGLCFASIQFRDHLDAYRQIVSTPASVAIAVVGAYWFVERVFL